MIITHVPADQIIELDGSTFDTHDAPTPAQLSDMLEDDGFQVDGGPVRIVDVYYEGGQWVAPYAIDEPDFGAIVEAQRQDPDPAFHDSNFYDITSRWR